MSDSTMSAPNGRFTIFTNPFYLLALLAFATAVIGSADSLLKGLAIPMGLAVMVSAVFMVGPIVQRIIGAVWPYLKWALIIGAVAAFSFPFVKAAFALENGLASIYTEAENTGAPACLGRGSKLDDAAMVAAHKTLPCGTRVLVTNKRNGAIAVVTIVDRGPFVGGRIIDLTKAAAARLGINGIAPVTVEVLS